MSMTEIKVQERESFLINRHWRTHMPQSMCYVCQCDGVGGSGFTELYLRYLVYRGSTVWSDRDKTHRVLRGFVIFLFFFKFFSHVTHASEHNG